MPVGDLPLSPIPLVSRKGRNDRKEGFHVADFYKDRFSGTCIKQSCFSFLFHRALLFDPTLATFAPVA
jgi:hypothetical protein